MSESYLEKKKIRRKKSKYLVMFSFYYCSVHLVSIPSWWKLSNFCFVPAFLLDDDIDLNQVCFMWNKRSISFLIYYLIFSSLFLICNSNDWNWKPHFLIFLNDFCLNCVFFKLKSLFGIVFIFQILIGPNLLRRAFLFFKLDILIFETHF